ncbi:MAG: hypothetical protein R2813_14120 [Flavobacteriales bacterium]
MTTTTTYTLLSLKVHPNSSQHIYIAMLMLGGNSSRFQFSKKRLDLVKELHGKDVHLMLKHILSALNEELNPTENGMDELLNASLWNEQYLDYLNRYSSNLIQFHKPVQVSLALTEENFQGLFAKYLGHADEPSHTVREYEHRVHHYIKTHLSERTNIDIIVDSSSVPGLIYPIKVSSLGENEAPFAVEAIDFSKRHDVIEHRVANLFHLKRVLADQGRQQANFFAIGEEPSKTNAVNHKIYQDLRSSGLLEIISENEQERVVKFAEEHDVQPWSSLSQ